MVHAVSYVYSRVSYNNIYEYELPFFTCTSRWYKWLYQKNGMYPYAYTCISRSERKDFSMFTLTTTREQNTLARLTWNKLFSSVYQKIIIIVVCMVCTVIWNPIYSSPCLVDIDSATVKIRAWNSYFFICIRLLCDEDISITP